MKSTAGKVMVSLAGIVAAGVIALAAEEHVAAPTSATSRYSGVAMVKAPDAKARTQFRVEVKDWQLEATEQAVKLPVAGFYIAQLKSGRIDTEIAGKKEHRNTGDFWTVAAGETMMISFPPHAESARIQVIAVASGGR
jgi:hypothetical protein